MKAGRSAGRAACAILTILMAATLAACAQTGAGTGGVHDPQDGSQSLIYKARGSVQCESPGVGPEHMAAELLQAGIAVSRYACAHDGRMHAAMCGGATGELNVFSIATRDVERARALGFHLLEAGTPPPREVECR